MRPLQAVVPALCLALLVAVAASAQTTAPAGESDFLRAIESAKQAIVADEQAIHEYETELRGLVANDPATVKRRGEIRILKKYYHDEIAAKKTKIVEFYRKIQDLRKGGRP